MPALNPSNIDLWNKLRAIFPQFKSHTAEATAELFTDAGFEALKAGDYPDALNDFFSLTLRVYLQVVNISQAEDKLDAQGFGEFYDNPNGGYIQRMAIQRMKPVSPKYKHLKNGSSVDPFVVNKPEVLERFFKVNFDYCGLLTMPDDFQMKQIFISPYGMDEFMTGIMKSLQNAYTIQKFENKLEAINAGINSTKFPLQASQQYELALSDDPTEAELTNFILGINNIISAMTIGPQSDGFNAMHYATMQDKTRLKILCRPGLKNVIKTKLLANAFNRDQLTFDADIVEVPHFGGLQAYKEEAFSTPLYPVYNSLGTVIGFNEAADQSTVTVETQNVFWKDPNENVLAVIADKGWLFHSIQNPYQVSPIYNPMGRYTNYIATSPNNTVAIDPLYNMVVVKNSSAA